MLSNVFTNPGQISNFIKEQYPNSEIQGVVLEGSFYLRWRVHSIQSDVYIGNAVDSSVFKKELAHFIAEAEISRLAGRRPILDTSRFALCCDLQNWGKFQRIALNISDEDCVKLVIHLLEKNTAPIQSLEEIGLAPSQLRKNPIEQNDLEIFRKLIDELEKMKQHQAPERANTIFQKLEETYPTVFKQLWAEMEEKSKKFSNQGNYKHILDRLNRVVIGQRFALELVANTLAGQENDSDKNQFFLFVGPPGVGKTELGKAAARLKKNRFTMLCMNRYTDQTSSNKLFGSSPGYVGSTSLPHFVQEIEKFNPEKKEENNSITHIVKNVVVVFDEMEKAHDTVKQSLLDLFMEGVCEAQYTEGSRNITKRYVFSGSIFIATSNLYQKNISKCLHEGMSCQQIANSFRKWNEDKPNPQSFSSEFLSRGTIVPFGPIPLGRDSYQKIIEIKLKAKFADLKKELPCDSIELERKEEVLQILEDLLYGNGTDIRKIDRFFHNSFTLNIRGLALENSVSLKNKTVVIFPVSNHLGIGVQFKQIFFGKPMHFLSENRLLYNPLEMSSL